MASKLCKAKQKLGSWKAEFNAMRKERRENRKEIAALKSDIGRHVQIANEYMREAERFRTIERQYTKYALEYISGDKFIEMVGEIILTPEAEQ